MKFPQACVLQFAKTPRAGRVKTRLMPALGEQGALQMHKKLVRHTWQTLHDANLASVQLWVDAADENDFFMTLNPAVEKLHQQQGTDLGARMAHAIEQALAQFELVVVVGSDCPVLDEAYLAAAFEALKQGTEVVLGPASDGGYVLIGMRRFYAEVFCDINWGSGEVLAQTRVRLAQLGCSWHELPQRWDVDRPEDLQKLAGLGFELDCSENPASGEVI